MREFNYFAIKQTGSVALVELNRPEKCNALNMEVWSEMDDLLSLIEKGETIRCVVLTGAGRMFSAGVDLSFFKELNTQWAITKLPWYQNINNRWENLEQPVIAAINGICFGAGTELALCADIRIADTNAQFSVPEVSFGLSPDMGASQRLTRCITPSQAKRLILGCEKIDAQEALRIGLVDELVEPSSLIGRAMELASNIASKAPLAVRMAKKAINVSMESSMRSGLYFEQVMSALCLGSSDKIEATNAYFEKRPPQFEGK
jgi:enoyl-CoA hydratase